VDGEQVQRNRLRRQVRADVEQLHRRRVLGADPLQADIPQRGDRVRPRGDLAPGVQRGGAPAQQVQVLLAGHLGTVHVRGGLFQRERELPELVRDLLPDLIAEFRDAGPQQPHSRRHVEHVQVQHPAQRREPAAPGRGDHMTRDPGRKRPARQPRRDLPHRVSVVEYQQPARHAAQRIVDLIAHRVRIGGRLHA
jgi:hypothetical protein